MRLRKPCRCRKCRARATLRSLPAKCDQCGAEMAVDAYRAKR